MWLVNHVVLFLFYSVVTQLTYNLYVASSFPCNVFMLVFTSFSLPFCMRFIHKDNQFAMLPINNVSCVYVNFVIDCLVIIG